MPAIRGIVYIADKLLVFHDEGIEQIENINLGLAQVSWFHRGYGCVQPDSITVGDGKVFFNSRFGPAVALVQQGYVFEPSGEPSVKQVALLGMDRVWQSANYWNEIMGERSLAMGAFFNHRWWIPVDAGGASNYVLNTVGCYDNRGQGWWTRLQFTGASSVAIRWGALGVIHAPLDHPLARKVILVGFPDYDGTNLSSQACKLKELEYGTTDDWGTLATDGQTIVPLIDSKACAFGMLDRWKNYKRLYARMRYPALAALTGSVKMKADQAGADSATMAFNADNTHTSMDVKKLISETSARGSGPYRDIGARLEFTAVTDSGWELTGWELGADIEAEQLAW
jgi:hypothetical protein